MPRRKRVAVPHCPHHVVHRGNRQQKVFSFEDGVFGYLHALADACFMNQVSVLAYCLMSNHVHLVLVPSTETGLSEVIRYAHGGHARRENRRESATGHLFEGRYYSIPLDERHLPVAIWFVENNPVRAGLVERATDYEWSSARGRLLGEPDPLLVINSDLGVHDLSEMICSESSFGDEELKLMRQSTVADLPLGDPSSWVPLADPDEDWPGTG
jgi:putative transposase